MNVLKCLKKRNKEVASRREKEEKDRKRTEKKEELNHKKELRTEKVSLEEANQCERRL